MTQWGIDTLFNPAKRHMDEEKRRLQSTREEVGDASGGKRIDLESGKVVIARTDAADDADDDGSDSADSSAATKRAKTDKSRAKSKDGDRAEPSAAAIRAARRRGREPR